MIETNSFRNITHISLSFIAGNDTAVKVYLAGLVKEFKSENALLQSKLDSTGSALSNKIKDSDFLVESLTQEIENLKLSQAQQLGKLELNYTKQLADEKERFSKCREETRLESEKSLRGLEMKYQEEVIIVFSLVS